MGRGDALRVAAVVRQGQILPHEDDGIAAHLPDQVPGRVGGGRPAVDAAPIQPQLPVEPALVGVDVHAHDEAGPLIFRQDQRIEDGRVDQGQPLGVQFGEGEEVVRSRVEGDQQVRFNAVAPQGLDGRTDGHDQRPILGRGQQVHVLLQGGTGRDENGRPVAKQGIEGRHAGIVGADGQVCEAILLPLQRKMAVGAQVHQLLPGKLPNMALDLIPEIGPDAPMERPGEEGKLELIQPLLQVLEESRGSHARVLGGDHHKAQEGMTQQGAQVPSVQRRGEDVWIRNQDDHLAVGIATQQLFHMIAHAKPQHNGHLPGLLLGLIRPDLGLLSGIVAAVDVHGLASGAQDQGGLATGRRHNVGRAGGPHAHQASGGLGLVLLEHVQILPQPRFGPRGAGGGKDSGRGHCRTS